jgi:UPF0176 protein
VRLPDFVQLREPLLAEMRRLGVRGSLLLANEGINGTVAGRREALDALLAYLRADDRFAAVDVKESYCDEMPFRRSLVRLKKEIVTMGVSDIDPTDAVGTYVDPHEWNELISDPDVILIDTRNEYEVAIGTFQGAQNPHTDSFREFPTFVDQHLDPSNHKKVAMFCTGGIRCEKSTALLKQKGFDQVYHLRGGILKYLETVPEAESKWEGECFVFDGRVSVGHGLNVGEHVMCFACGWPVSQQDQQHADFVHGIHCPRCVNDITPEQKDRFQMRQQQMLRDQQQQQRIEP